MNDLLKEAIADAKAVREFALANAKLALEEAFTPRLQSMIASKLAEESEDDEMMGGDEFDAPVEEGEDEEEFSFDAPVEEGEDEEMEAPVEDEGGEFAGQFGDEEAPAEEPVATEEPVEEPAEEPVEEGEDEEMDPELQEILRQLEEELDSSDIGGSDNKKPSASASDDNTQDPGKGDLFEDEAESDELSFGGEEEEDVDIQEIIRALREEDEEGEEAPVEEPVAPEASSEDLDEAYAVIRFLKDKLNEVNLLNSKLLFSNKLFRKYSLNENQKMTVIENFDRAGTVREVKLVYATLAEALRSQSNKPVMKRKTSLKEGLGSASKSTPTTRPSKKILTEADESTNRFKKLAGIIK